MLYALAFQEPTSGRIHIAVRADGDFVSVFVDDYAAMKESMDRQWDKTATDAVFCGGLLRPRLIPLAPEQANPLGVLGRIGNADTHLSIYGLQMHTIAPSAQERLRQLYDSSADLYPTDPLDFLRAVRDLAQRDNFLRNPIHA